MPKWCCIIPIAGNVEVTLESETEPEYSDAIDAWEKQGEPGPYTWEFCDSLHGQGNVMAHFDVASEFETYEVTDDESNPVDTPATVVDDYVDVVFDGPPGNTPGRFVEVENARGESISVGEWVERPDGYWALRLPKGSI